MSRIQLQRVLFGLINGTLGFARHNRMSVRIFYSRPIVISKRTAISLGVTIDSANVNVTPTSRRRVFGTFARDCDRDSHGFNNAKLNLAVARHLARLVNNAVTISDRLNQNDAFVYRLRQIPIIARGLPGLTTSPPSVSLGRLSPLAVLIVSSTPSGQRLVTKCFHKARRRVLFTRSKLRKLRVTRTRLPGLVLLSLQVPLVSNRRATRTLQGDPTAYTVPVVLVATSLDCRKRVLISDSLCRNFLRGPIGHRRLITVVRRIIRTIPTNPASYSHPTSPNPGPGLPELSPRRRRALLTRLRALRTAH